ncbi:hypothetical protein [Lactiplantibacillus plajomi]|nr:hypothetical protein [Lactiplantibacillus plajomi]
MGRLMDSGKWKFSVQKYPDLVDIQADYTENGWITDQTKTIQIVLNNKMVLPSNYVWGPFFDKDYKNQIRFIDSEKEILATGDIPMVSGIPGVARLTLPMPKSVTMSILNKQKLISTTGEKPVYLTINYGVWKWKILWLSSVSTSNEFALARFPAKTGKNTLNPKIIQPITVESTSVEGTATIGNTISLLSPSGNTSTTKVNQDGTFHLNLAKGILTDTTKIVIKEENNNREYGLARADVTNPFQISAKNSHSDTLLLTPKHVITLTNNKVKPKEAARQFADDLQNIANIEFKKNNQKTTQLDHLVLEDDFRDDLGNQSYARAILGQLFDGEVDHQVLTLRGANKDETILSNPYELTVRLSPAIQVESQPIGSLQVPAKPTLQRLAPAPQLAVQHSYANLRVFATAQPLKTRDGQQLELVYRDGHGGAPQPLRTKQLIGVTTTQPQTNLTTDWYQAAVAGSPQDKGIFVVVPPSVRQAQYSGEITWSVEDVPSSSE